MRRRFDLRRCRGAAATLALLFVALLAGASACNAAGRAPFREVSIPETCDDVVLSAMRHSSSALLVTCSRRAAEPSYFALTSGGQFIGLPIPGPLAICDEGIDELAIYCLRERMEQRSAEVIRIDLTTSVVSTILDSIPYQTGQLVAGSMRRLCFRAPGGRDLLVVDANTGGARHVGVATPLLNIIDCDASGERPRFIGADAAGIVVQGDTSAPVVIPVANYVAASLDAGLVVSLDSENQRIEVSTFGDGARQLAAGELAAIAPPAREVPPTYSEWTSSHAAGFVWISGDEIKRLRFARDGWRFESAPLGASPAHAETFGATNRVAFVTENGVAIIDQVAWLSLGEGAW